MKTAFTRAALSMVVFTKAASTTVAFSTSRPMFAGLTIFALATSAQAAQPSIAKPTADPAAADFATLATTTTATETSADADSSDPAVVEALLFDLDKIVELRIQRGWTIDRIEIDAMLPDALLSLCRVPMPDRTAAVEALRRRIDAAGGPAAARWRAGERDLDRLEPVIEIERTLSLLRAAIARADQDCPFYIAVDPHFAGRQRDSEGWTLNAEGGGLFSVGGRDGSLRVGGGGAARVSVGLGLGPHWSVRFGPEIGGAALINDRLRSDDVTVDLLVALPVALRRTLGAMLFDVEAAPIAVGIPWQSAPARWGGRVAFLFGVSTLRLREVLPWTGVVLMTEAVAPRGGEGWMWSVRAGVRVGFAWNPGS